ncbi:hypothetical protein LJ739_15940 [Aestuariibacter halophilus]|uniref:DUF4405 domain-containing protein n=1 Tax=Fluctibacter halophilus TaxID=226011 RepID=A0ABS8GAY5_9ALTE|nr:hypothetical protein [Aestuariibacter halophilus]MCC2617744.1 hypothetical protein [Aestuariibacter halophilus]
MRRLKGYPRLFYPLLLLALLVVIASGVLMTPTMLEFKLALSQPWRVPGVWWTTVAGSHAASGWLVSLLVGALWSVHMRSHWRKKQQRVTGLVNGLLMLVLGATAIGLYYASEEVSQYWLALLHVAGGAGFCVFFVAHAFGRRATNALD